MVLFSADILTRLHGRVQWFTMLSTFWILLICFLTRTTQSKFAGIGQGSCSKSISQWSCVLGCFTCAEFFGRKEYNMMACCDECARTKLSLVDEGPDYCATGLFSKDYNYIKYENQVKKENKWNNWNKVNNWNKYANEIKRTQVAQSGNPGLTSISQLLHRAQNQRQIRSKMMGRITQQLHHSQQFEENKPVGDRDILQA